MVDEIILTQEGYDNLVKEREDLVSIRRHEVSERLKEAISYGDLSENAEYDAAKNEQAELEEKIYKLDNMIRKAKIIDEKDMTNDHVDIGLTVKIRIQETGDEDEYTLVGTTEADPFNGKISNESPVGKALIGSKKGSVVEIIVPAGVVHYEILDIRR